MRTFDLLSLCLDADPELRARTPAYRMRNGRVFYSPTPYQPAYGIGHMRIGEDFVIAPTGADQDTEALADWLQDDYDRLVREHG